MKKIILLCVCLFLVVPAAAQAFTIFGVEIWTRADLDADLDGEIDSDKLPATTTGGDVTGPAGATAGNFPVLDATGKVLSDSGTKPADFLTVETDPTVDTSEEIQDIIGAGVYEPAGITESDISDLQPYLLTELQDLTLTGNTLAISGDPNTDVDLSGYMDNTDDQIAAEVLITDTNGRTDETTVEGWLDELAADVSGIVSFTWDYDYTDLINKPTIPSGNQIIDWTADQGATDIHAGNYTDTDTTYTDSDFDIKDLTDSTNLRTAWSGKYGSIGDLPTATVSEDDSTHIATNEDIFDHVASAISALSSVYQALYSGIITDNATSLTGSGSITVTETQCYRGKLKDDGLTGAADIELDDLEDDASIIFLVNYGDYAMSLCPHTGEKLRVDISGTMTWLDANDEADLSSDEGDMFIAHRRYSNTETAWYWEIRAIEGSITDGGAAD